MHKDVFGSISLTEEIQVNMAQDLQRGSRNVPNYNFITSIHPQRLQVLLEKKGINNQLCIIIIGYIINNYQDL